MLLLLSPMLAHAQVGIGTDQPQEKLHVFDGSIMATTSPQPANVDPYFDPAFPVPVNFEMKWFHDKAAFRSIGERNGAFGLNPALVGMFSFASGFEVFANGVAATAFGLKTEASGKASFASGEGSTASGYCSFVHGLSANASGDHSVAFGTSVSTNGMEGAFVFGDNSNIMQLSSTQKNQISMRFMGGYQFFSNANQSVGVQLAPGGNAWQIVSDVNKKEKFSPVNGEDFLSKIANLPLSSWNYKGQDPQKFRHYGPMAQDFYAAFGHDEYGTIGTDTTINQADLEGVNLIAIQALVKRTDELRQRNDQLLLKVAEIKARLAENELRSGNRKRRNMDLSKK